MVEQIYEAVEVLASFSSGGKLMPKKFRWRKKVYEIEKIHQTHQSREGTALLTFFHCSDAQSTYRKFCFNNVTKVWMLEEMEVDPTDKS